MTQVSDVDFSEAHSKLSPRQANKYSQFSKVAKLYHNDKTHNGVSVVLHGNAEPVAEEELNFTARRTFGQPWQPFSYTVRQERGQRPGTHNKD